MMESPTPLEILFADNDLAATRPLRVELRRRGARVHLVDTAADAIRQATLAAPDLVVLDETLKQHGDSDLLSFFRERHPQAEIILLHSDSDVIPHGSGFGLLFSVRKPVSKESLLEVILSAFPGRLDGGKVGPPPSHTLLCVDDDPVYLNSLKRTLSRRGYQVSCHENANRALEVLPSLHPELAIVDIRMPGMDGLALTRRIQEISKGKVPVVVLTALPGKEAYHRARESGASYCLTKPCRPEDFLNIVDFIAGDLDEEERQLLRSRLAQPAAC